MSCCICLSKIKYNSNIIQCVQCKKQFHEKCFMKWYTYNDKMNQCPHCNYISMDKMTILQYIPDDNNNIDYSFSSSYTSSSDNDIEQNNIDDTNLSDNELYLSYSIDDLYPNRNRHIAHLGFFFFIILLFASIIALLYKYKIINLT